MLCYVIAAGHQPAADHILERVMLCYIKHDMLC